MGKHCLRCRFPNQIMNIINGQVALQRIQKFMEVGPFCTVYGLVQTQTQNVTTQLAKTANSEYWRIMAERELDFALHT